MGRQHDRTAVFEASDRNGALARKSPDLADHALEIVATQLGVGDEQAADQMGRRWFEHHIHGDQAALGLDVNSSPRRSLRLDPQRAWSAILSAQLLADPAQLGCRYLSEE